MNSSRAMMILSFLLGIFTMISAQSSPTLEPTIQAHPTQKPTPGGAPSSDEVPTAEPTFFPTVKTCSPSFIPTTHIPTIAPTQTQRPSNTLKPTQEVRLSLNSQFIISSGLILRHIRMWYSAQWPLNP